MLLERLVRYWDPNQQFFRVGHKILTLEVEDIYFIMGLSRHGALIILTGGKGGATNFVDNYIAAHYHPKARKSSKKVPIKDIVDLPLCTILFTITWVTSSIGPHLASKAHMYYTLECLNLIVFNWCTKLLVSLRHPLIKCRTSHHK